MAIHCADEGIFHHAKVLVIFLPLIYRYREQNPVVFRVERIELYDDLLVVTIACSGTVITGKPDLARWVTHRVKVDYIAFKHMNGTAISGLLGITAISYLAIFI